MKKDFLVDVGVRIKYLFETIGVLCLTCFILTGIFYFITVHNNDNTDMVVLLMRIFGVGTILGGIATIIPTPKSIFKTRITLLKLELTNKENIDTIVKKGNDALDKIVVHLENKYFYKGKND